MVDLGFPTETIDLPSRGWFYPKGHPLASGKVELLHMTAKHEDILTSKSLWLKGVAIDKLMEALIADKNVKYRDMILGDKSAIIIAARILAYGKTYECNVTCPKCKNEIEQQFNLEDFEETPYDFESKPKGTNEFEFLLPLSGKLITFKLLTHGDEVDIRAELDGMKKFNKSGVDPDLSTRMRYSIVAVDGDRNKGMIREFTEAMPVRDARAFREFAGKQMPLYDTSFNFNCLECGYEGVLGVPFDMSFFLPE